MGVCGTGILDDDDAVDVNQWYLRLYSEGKRFKRHPAIRRAIEQQFAEEFQDEDTGPVVTMALAYSQWECGYQDLDMIAKVGYIVDSGINLERWEDTPDYQARAEALRAFYAQIMAGNPTPRSRKRLPKSKPVFQAGDCLAIRLSQGQYGAALVLADRITKSGGENLVGLLSYIGSSHPPMEVFEKREWFLLNHHGYKNETCIHWCFPEDFDDNGSYECIGHSEIRPEDPQASAVMGGWVFGMELEDQLRWDAGER